MSSNGMRKAFYAYLLLLIPLGYLAARFDPYAIDGDAVAYMDLADLIHAHHWAQVVNGYWNPLYPAVLCLGQIFFRPTRMNELGAYYHMNLLLFGLQVIAILVFVSALGRWRAHVSPLANPLLSTRALQLTGLVLQTTFLMRELSLGKIRTDGFLEALLLLSLAMLMESLSTVSYARSLCFASLTGVFFGLAYLTKSVAFIVALVACAMVVFFSRFLKRSFPQAVLCGTLLLAALALVAGPYVYALSLANHRFDMGDSGPLNYAWAVSNTAVEHLEPGQTDRYGSARVQLIHPQIERMRNPGVYSYREHPMGTYPAWFAPAYFNERVTPIFSFGKQLRTTGRNVVLLARYLLGHPEPLVLLAVLLALGGRFGSIGRIAGPCLCIGCLIWVLYLAVVIEDRYVSFAYAAVLLPLFASLRDTHPSAPTGSLQRIVSPMLILCACIVMADAFRTVAANRRDQSVHQVVPAWRDQEIYGAAGALAQLGIQPGDAIACMGTKACVYDQYWARLSGARILTEIYLPDSKHLVDQFDRTSDRAQVLQVVQAQGARVLVGNFDPGAMNESHPGAKGWIRLGETSFYALPLNLPSTGPAIH